MYSINVPKACSLCFPELDCQFLLEKKKHGVIVACKYLTHHSVKLLRTVFAQYQIESRVKLLR